MTVRLGSSPRVTIVEVIGKPVAVDTSENTHQSQGNLLR